MLNIHSLLPYRIVWNCMGIGCGVTFVARISKTASKEFSYIINNWVVFHHAEAILKLVYLVAFTALQDTLSHHIKRKQFTLLRYCISRFWWICMILKNVWVLYSPYNAVFWLNQLAMWKVALSETYQSAIHVSNFS